MDQAIIARFQEFLAHQGRSPGTIHGYLSDLILFAQWVEQATGKPFAPARVAHLDILSYRAHLQSVQGLAPATINRRLQAVRTFFSWACRQELVKSSPAADIESVRTTRQQFAPKALSPEQAGRLVHAARAGRHPERDYALLQVLLQAGLRVSEAAGLRREDAQINESSGRLRVRAGKGQKERAVPLNATARRALCAYLATHLPDDGIPYLFASQKGGRLTGRAIGRIVAACVRRAGLAGRGVSAHTLRHTFATQYLEQNPGQLVELAALLGHSDLNTTAIYTQPSFDAVARKLELSALNVDAQAGSR